MIVYRASRLEALLEPLHALLAAAPPDGLLQPAELITAHPGMRRWLLNRLAEAGGRYGIAANIDIDLPGQWIDRLSRRWQPGLSDAQSAYGTDALRWRLFELAGAISDGNIEAPRLAEYLDADPAGPRRWQLAAALGELFGRLLVYRPDWLQAWARGQQPIEGAGELPALWRALRERIGSPHRSERHAELLRAVAEAPGGDAPLHVFGLSHLPPRHLDVLRAVSRKRLVVMYCPDPCVEHWAGLGNERARLRQLLEAPAGPEVALLHLETGHPLLASLGRLGQQFGALLAAAEEDIVIDVRHSLDAEPQRGALGSRLGRLQESIRRLDAGLVAADSDRGDASLRLHRCHSRWRELEVLRDALLKARVDLPDLRPSEIAVLAPSMADYLPLLGAVFGPAGSADTPLPYHVADLPIGRSHPLHLAWFDLLQQARQRSTAPGLMALLRLGAVRRALDLDEADLESLQHGLGAAAAALGLDGEARADEGLPPLEAHTLGWGLDRLCLAYALGDEEGEPALLDGLRPSGAPDEGDAHALGALYRLLSAIKRLRIEAGSPRPAGRWIDLFRRLWQSLFRVDPALRDEVDSEDALLECLAGAQRAIADAGVDPTMSHAQAMAMLDGLLAQLGGRGAFLHGGITFCGMVPQRALPYRMICVLGMSESDFPRRPTAVLGDPMPRHPRIGDRDVVSDDRFLFLETLMSARDRLHLSWVGEDPRDGSAREPSPVLGELIGLLQSVAGAEPREAWLIEHPLQPFDVRYARDPAAREPLHSFGPIWRPAPVPVPGDGAELPEPAAAALRIESLRGWLRNPAQELLRQRWRMPMRGLDTETLPADEPLDTRLDAREALWRPLLQQALVSGRAPPDEPDEILLASGQLPPGRPGRMAYARQAAIARALFEESAGLPCFALPSQRLVPDLSFELEGQTIEGRPGPVWRCGKVLWLVEFADEPKRFKGLSGRLDLALRAALLGLCLQPGEALQVLRLAPGKQDSWAATLSLEASDLTVRRAGLEQVVSTIARSWEAALREPLAYFPKASQALLEDGDIAGAWLGSDRQTGERDWSPGYAWLLAGEREFWDARDPASPLFAETARRLAALLAPGPERGA
nr:exodeoxyribonuclease V subunit gamma [Lysobacter sp. CAU 1642]